MILYVNRAGHVMDESEFGRNSIQGGNKHVRQHDGVNYYFFGAFDSRKSVEVRRAARRKVKDLERATMPKLSEIDIPESMCRVRAHLRQRPGKGARKPGTYSPMYLDGPKEVIMERIFLNNGKVIYFPTPPQEKKHKKSKGSRRKAVILEA